MGPDSTQPTDDGFTLIELLIVIVILGVLATVTVFAVRGITEQGEQNACEVELDNLQKAQAVHWTLNGTYADEPTLVSNGTLRTESTMYDVTATVDTYQVVPVGNCTGSVSDGAAPAPAPVVMPTASITWHGRVTAWRYGPDADGADEIVVLGREQGKADWVVATDAGASSTRRVHFVDIDSLDVTALETLLANINNNGLTALGVYTADDTTALPGSTAAGVYAHLLGRMPSYPRTTLYPMNSASTNLQSLFAIAP